MAPGWWRSQAVSALRAAGSQNLRSEARALRKYACGASAKWATVHAGQKEIRAATALNSVLATRAKANNRSRLRQKGKYSDSIAISTRCCYSVDCVKGYNAN
eukprot:6182910-Pleurochrysis_carterae.AAC.3